MNSARSFQIRSVTSRFPAFLAATVWTLLLTACPPGQPPPPTGISGGGGSVIPGTRWTNRTSLNTPSTNPLRNVDVRCCLTLRADATLTEECRFFNNSNTDLRFIYCDMIDLTADKRSPNMAPSGSPRCDLVQEGNVVKCVDRATSGARESSYHFGCKLVQLPANGTASITIQGATTYVPWSTFDVRASDFVVNYSDVWNLTGSPLTFDDASCNKVNGQAGWLVPIGPFPDVAIWAVSQLPFDDPYLQHQRADGETTGEPIYVRFDAPECAPPGLEVPATHLKPCRPPTERPPATEVDLHLFWWRSHMGDEPTPAVIKLEAEGVGEAIRVEAEPSPGEPFVMEPGEEAMGTLRLCAADVEDRCFAPPLPEGESATVRALFLHAETGEELFHQEVQFLKDTEPPRVRRLAAERTEKGLSLSVEAEDRTAGVAHVHAVFSTDGGRTWSRQSLESEQDLLADDPRQVRFAGEIPLGPLAGEKEETMWYLVVQDGVFNLTYVSPPGGP